MILEGNARAHGAELARHLMNTADNDHVTVHLIQGFVADDLRGAFEEVEAISQATQCQKYLFSLSLNPPLDANVSEDVFEETAERAAEALGLDGQPFVLVFHEKNGRRHAHAVWSRIDTDTMKAINHSHFKRKLTALSRELYLEHGWDMPEGFKDHAKRDQTRFDHGEAGQAKRAKRDPTAMKAMFRACWEHSDGMASFAAALREQGFELARGDRRGFVAVDANGKVWSLSRWCEVKARELRRKLPDFESLPDLDEAKRLAKGRGHIKSPEKDPRRHKALDALVARQREERQALLDRQRLDEVARLQAQPKGMRLAFLKITGQFKAHVTRSERAKAEADAKAAQDRQAMITRHISERREAERKLALTQSFDRATRSDPRQRLELKEEKSALTAAQLRASPERILEEISKTKASFTRRDTLHALSRVITDPRELSTLASRALKSDEAVQLSSDQVPVYTTRDYLRAETRLHQTAEALHKSHGAKVDAANISVALRTKTANLRRSFGGELSTEQEAAIRTVLSDRQLVSVVGLAGAGKSTMLSAAADAWRRQGVTVHGAALAGKAADGLQEASQIPSRTLASLELSWENGNTPVAKGDVLVVDEAGMIGTRQLARVTRKCQEIGAKLVLVGDPEQLQPIEAGTPFRDIVDRQGAARLTEIHRQKEDWQRNASRQLAEGKTAEAVETYRKHGAVHEHVKQDDAIEALAERYAMDQLSETRPTSRLALAHKRRDVHALNQAIRAALRDGDEGEDVLLQTATGKRAFAKKDRIVFTRNDKDLGVKNGMLGTVEMAADGKVKVQIDGQSQQTVTFDPRTYQHFDHGYAVTIHKSQGVTVDQAYVLGSRSIDQNLAYVAMTRHRQDVQVFASGEDRPRWSLREHSYTKEMGRNQRERSGPSI